MRRVAIPLLIVALLVAAFAVLQRGVEIRAPESGGIDPFRGIDIPAHPPRVRKPERTESPPPRSVRIAVTSMDGKPIAGARIELVPGLDDDLPRRFVPDAAAPQHGRAVAADESGSATIADVPPGRWFVLAEAPGFARHALAGTVRDGDEPVDTTVALEKGFTFAGTVRDPDGAPAAGVAVILVPYVTYVSDATCPRTTTSNDGSYRFEGVEAGAYRVWYVPRAGLCVAEATVLVPQLDGLDIRMARGAAIEGTVHDADTGGAVSAARVLAFGYTASGISGIDGLTVLLDVGVTDQLGRFSMRTWRRRTDLSYLLVDEDGYAANPVGVGGRVDAQNVQEGQRFVADLRVRRAGAVTGTVRIDGRPVAGIGVGVRPEDGYAIPPPGGRGWTTFTASDGRYRCDRLPPGSATISMWGDHPSPPFIYAMPVEITAGSDSECDVTLEPRRVRVTRRVADDAEVPKPLAGVDVVQRIGPLSAAARTDADGRFTMDAWFFEDHAPVELRRGAFVQASVISADDEDGDDLNPGPPAADAAKGIVVGPDGAPAAGVRVELTAGMEFDHESALVWRGLREAVSGSDGTFRLPVLSGPGFCVRAVRTPWLDGERDEDGSWRIQLPEAFRFDGRVVASETGEPIPRALVFDAFDNVITRTDSDGRFAVEGPPSQIREVRVASEGRLDATAEPEPDAWVIALRPAFSVAGVVRLADGSPVPGAVVGVERTLFTTDGGGRFVISGLDAGKCGLNVSDPKRHAITATRVVVEAGTQDVSIVVAPGVRVVVRLTDVRGKPVAWAQVSLHVDSPDVEDVTAEASSHGEAVFGLAPDVAYTIRVEREGYQPAERRDVRAGEEPVNIVLTPAADR